MLSEIVDFVGRQVVEKHGVFSPQQREVLTAAGEDGMNLVNEEGRFVIPV